MSTFSFLRLYEIASTQSQNISIAVDFTKANLKMGFEKSQ